MFECVGQSCPATVIQWLKLWKNIFFNVKLDCKAISCFILGTEHNMNIIQFKLPQKEQDTVTSKKGCG